MSDLPEVPHQARMLNLGRTLLGLARIDYNELAGIPLLHLKDRHEHWKLEVQKAKDEMEDFRVEHQDYRYSPHYASYCILEQKLRDKERQRDKYAAEIARREDLSPAPEAEIQNDAFQHTSKS